MEIDVGMSRAGLRKLAHEILDACDQNLGRGQDIEVVCHAEANSCWKDGSALKLTFNNEDMEDRDDIGADSAFWEKMS